jgi:hypothetical protein
MVASLDTRELDTSDDKQPESLSLRERLRSTTQDTLNKLANWKDSLTQKVEIETTDQLNELHADILATTPEAERLAFESLKKEVVDQHKQIKHDTATLAQEPNDTYIPNNIAADQDPALASSASIQKHRAQAANRVATMIEEELFDPNSWSLI